MKKLEQDIKSNAQELVKLARAANITVSTAESCTGGGIGAAITAVSGASQVFQGGIIAYANSVKIKNLYVSPRLIEQHGAVSKAVAIAMAEGANEALNTGIAVSVTGIAGPAGGTANKPVGTVWIGLAQKGQATQVNHFEFVDNARESIRTNTINEALKLLCAALQAKTG
ncbi:MAG: CinA family protein [Robiginitomaculum sp.]|nr:CinA family protein [Robiginitomaculum sp.]